MTEEQSLQKYENMLTGGDLFVAAAVIGGIGVAGSVVSGISSSKAAGAQASAAQAAADGEKAQYQQNRTDQQPYMNSGTHALDTINNDLSTGTGFAAPFSLSNFMSSPGYQFQLQQGQNAVNSSAAATGGTLNGGTLKALQQYTSGLANSTYGDAYNRYLSTSQQQYGQLFNLANLGEQATSTLGNQGVQTAQAAGNDLTQVGNAKAAGDIGVGNAINSGLSSVGAVLGSNAIKSSQSGYSGTYNPTQTSSPDMG